MLDWIKTRWKGSMLNRVANGQNRGMNWAWGFRISNPLVLFLSFWTLISARIILLAIILISGLRGFPVSQIIGMGHAERVLI